MTTVEELARTMEQMQSDALLALTQKNIHIGARTAAEQILGPGRAGDVKAFADLVLARFDEITGAYGELASLDRKADPAQLQAAVSKFVAAATFGVTVGMLEALRLGVRGLERGRTQ